MRTIPTAQLSKQNSFTEPKTEEKAYQYAKPNFGTNAAKEEKQEEHYEQIQITVDENVYDPQNPDEYIETDVDDILND